MTRTRWLMAVVVWLCGVGGVGAAFAQTTADGTIRGSVRDAQGAVLPGVTVTAASATVPGLHTGVSDDSGAYRIGALPPGTYTVSAELDGFSRFLREGIVMRAGLALTVDVTMQVGALNETVTVQAETPMLDNANITRSVNVSGELQRSLPLSGRRDWADFMYATPGMTSVEFPGVAGLFYLHGADFSSHVLQVDGADIGSAQQGYNGFLNFNTDAIADVQVKTGAVDASSPMGLGAVVSMATPSGTNVLRGSASAVFQARAWNGNNTPGGTSAASEIFQPDLSAGGPILRDRLWFFGSYRYTRTTTGVFRSAAQVTRLKALAPEFEPFDSENKANFSYLKSNAQLGSKHQAQLFYQYDGNPSDLVLPTDTERFVNRGPDGSGVGARVSSVWSTRWTSRISASFNNKANQVRMLRPEATARNVYQQVTESGGRLLGSTLLASLDNNTNGGYEQPYRKLVLSADVNYFKTGWLGQHDVQVGLYAQPLIRQDSRLQLAAGGFVVEDHVLRDPANPAAGTRAFHRQVYDRDRVQEMLLDNTDYAVYVQDAWRPTGRLTISAGVRLDVVSRTDQLFDVKVQDSVEIGPRLGASYALTADQRNIVRVAWSRVHETLAQNAVTAGTNRAGFTDFYDPDGDGVFQVALPTLSAATVNRNREIDLDRGQPYVNELIASYQRQLPGQVTVDASYVRREYRARTGYVEVNGLYDGHVWVGVKDQTQPEIYRITENVWNYPVYTGLELQVAKQTRRLQVLASYARQWRELEGTYQPNDPALRLQPEAFANDKGIGSTRGALGDANSLSGTSMAGAAPWRDHTLRLAAFAQGPWDTLFGTSFVIQSGPWSGPIVTQVPVDPQYGPARLPLPNGSFASNPLATQWRFAYATRGEGQVRLKAIPTWNLRAGKRLRVADRPLDLSVEVFNVTNSAKDQGLLGGGNQQGSVNFLQGTSRQPPRSAQVTARFAF